jgi:iron complex outermembrane recepter protein
MSHSIFYLSHLQQLTRVSNHHQSGLSFEASLIRLKTYLRRWAAGGGHIFALSNKKTSVMKKQLLFVFALLASLFTRAQAVSYSPLNGSFDNDITIEINLNLASGASLPGLLGKTEGLYMWAGAGSSEANAFEFMPKGQINFNAPFAAGLLKNTGPNRWQITLNPRSYFNMPAGKTITVIGLLVKNTGGSAQTENMILKPGGTKTAEAATVVAKKPFIEVQVDKTVLNVQSDITSQGSTVFEILQKAPGVVVTGDDNIGLSGKGSVNVLIDGRPTQMSARDLANYLKATPGGNADKIEIITNPSAKYDAQGSAGIINIKFKRNKNLGTNGNFSSSYTQNVHNRNDATLNLNSRGKKTNVFGNMGMSNSQQHTTGGLSRVIYGNVIKYFENSTVDQERYRGQNFRLGADYYLNKKSTLGLLIVGNNAVDKMNTPGETLIKNSSKQLDSSVSTFNSNRNKAVNQTYNLNYKYEDTLGNEWNADADYTRFRSTINTRISSSLLNKNGLVYDAKQNLLNTQTDIDIYSFRVDYVKTMKRINAKLEAGVKTNFVDTRNDLQAQKNKGNTLVADSGRTNMFEYKENVNAAYINFGKQAGKFEYQLGLRLEQTNINGLSRDISKASTKNPDTSYLNLFPSAFVKYTLSEKSQLLASFSRRLNRPNYQSMNPFEAVLDIYTAEKGNPYLRPEYSNNYELKYVYRGAASLGIGYTTTQDVIETIASQQGEKTFAAPQNLATKRSWYAQFNLPVPVTKNYFLYTGFTIFRNQYLAQIPEGRVNQAAWGASGYMSHNLTLKKGFRLQLNGWLSAPGVEGIAKVKPLGSLNLGLQKSLLKDRLQLRASFNDLFNTQRYEQTARLNTIDYTYFRKWESRGFTIGLNWKFGNNNVKQARERNIAEDAGRIKVKKAD